MKGLAVIIPIGKLLSIIINKESSNWEYYLWLYHRVIKPSSSYLLAYLYIFWLLAYFKANAENSETITDKH